jgi:hypothetical protein
MLQATPVGMLSAAYEISRDGMPVARWDAKRWRSGGFFSLDGERYEVRGNIWGNEFTMTDSRGATVASAGKVSRRQWTVVCGRDTYQFQRPSIWRQRFDLVLGGTTAGFVRRPSGWRRDVEADLPTLPSAAQVFTLVVAITVWDAASSAAAGATATT